MEQLKFSPKLKGFWNKYKYVLLILLLGLVFMAIPERSQEEQTEPTEPVVTRSPAGNDFAAALEDILSQIQGAGEVRVLLSEATGAQTVYQTDSDTQNDGQGSSVRVETVIVSQGSGVQGGLIVQTNPGTYRGAIILCAGADDPLVKLQVTEAVSKATGLGTDRISVLKLKA